MKRLRMDTAGQPNLKTNTGETVHYTWFRGDSCNFNPVVANLLSADSVPRYVLEGWAPDAPLIDLSTTVTAFGSCFATNITRWLSERKFSVLTAKDGADADTYVVRFGEGMVNTFVIRQQFEWALEGKTFEESLWHGYDAQTFGYDESLRLRTRDLFMRTDVFILTLGLSEVWYDEISGGVFWRAVPQDKYDASRHKFRVSSVAENKDNLRAIYELIRKYRPNARVIFTLSPIPLVATFRDVSCMTANSVSKAILRAALDEFLREVGYRGPAYYWPSYEIVLDVFGDRWKPDRRHVKDEILDFVMTLFEHTWCSGTAPRYTLPEAWLRARVEAGTFPRKALDAIRDGDTDVLQATRRKLISKEREEDAELLVRAALTSADVPPETSSWAQRVLAKRAGRSTA